MLTVVPFVTGCRTVKETRTSASVDERSRMTEVVRTKTDSVFVERHDSVWVEARGDTVFVDRWHTRYEYRTKTDTLTRVDTLMVYSAGETFSEVKKGTALGWSDYAALGLLIVFGIAMVFKFNRKD
jgi:hypothetical protein